MQESDPISLEQLKQGLPMPCDGSRLNSIREKSKTLNRTIVVLDDDPTGTQTVYDVPVLTDWSVELIAQEFANQEPLLFLLTNSRSLPEQQAETVANEIGSVLVRASEATGRDFEIVSRSDSTLRGHYPSEVNAIARATGQENCPQFLIPFFLEGNRLTINDIHYVVENDQMTPAALTPFAQDSAFGYQSSNLKQWVQEKTGGNITAEQVRSISIEQLRSKHDEVRV